MERSERKKKAAAQQESLGKAQIKNKVKTGQTGTLGQYTGKIKDAGVKIPVGQERLDIAKKMRKEATTDSLAAVKMNKPKGQSAKKSVIKTASKSVKYKNK